MVSRARYAVVALASVLALGTAWLYGTMAWDSQFAYVAAFGYNTLSALASYACLLAGRDLRQAGDSRGAFGWTAVSLGALLIFVAQAVNILQIGPTPSYTADIVAIIAYPLFGVALLAFVPRRGSLAARTIQGLDVAMLLAAAVTLTLAIHVNTQGVEATKVTTSAFYLHVVPTMAIATLLGAALFFMRSPAYFRPGATVAAAAIAFAALADVILAISPGVWDRWSNVEYALASLLFTVAAARAQPAHRIENRSSVAPSRIPYFAVGCVALALLATLWRIGAKDVMAIAAGGATVMSLLATRHWATLQANVDLERRNADAERRLREADRLDALGNMARGVAHDFNGMLLSILTNAELAAEEIDEDPVAAHESVAHIRQAALTARDLTARLLAFARSGTVEMHEVDCVAIARTQWPVLSSALPSTVRASITLPETPLLVRTGPGFVEQVLYNLVTNARDALPSGGELAVAIHRDGSDAMITVRDSGIGMDDATRARLFEPFFTTKMGRGSGLGLATVYGIVKQTGGELDVQSQPGNGTTFLVRLPLSAA